MGHKQSILDSVKRITAIALILLPYTPLLLSSTSAAPLDCNKFFKPADNSFPFAWRNDRCEGFVEQKTAFTSHSVKISYFGYGNIEKEGPKLITNKTSSGIELHGELLSRGPFYRLVAILDPNQSIHWNLPKQLQDMNYGPDKISMLATKIDSNNIHLPATVSNSNELWIGIYSTDMPFNAATVTMFDAGYHEVCKPKTYKFHHLIVKLHQKTFALDLGNCDGNFHLVRHIVANAVLSSENERKTSTSDEIAIE